MPCAGDYRARYYNPTTGRFLSEDPMGFLGSGPNLYAYAGNNPISFRDSFGLKPHDFGFGGGAFGGGGAGGDWGGTGSGSGSGGSNRSGSGGGLGNLAAAASAGTGAGIAGASGASSEAAGPYAGMNAFWAGTDGEAAAIASGANVLELSPEAATALAAGNPTLMFEESALYAQGTVGEGAVAFLGNGVGYTFFNYELEGLDHVSIHAPARGQGRRISNSQ
jgi:uncharacterized protein RhaS with RHS repeats